MLGRGTLLVATPAIEDPNFKRTVILLLAHSAEGSVGVILNRPSELTVREVAPAWTTVSSEPAVVFLGGPVSPESVIHLGLASDGEAPDSWLPLLDRLGVVDASADPDQLPRPLSQARIFLGYSGWGPGQLKEEIDSDGWYVVPGRPSDAFSGRPELLWSRVLRRQGGELAIVATYPADIELN
ncbi:MAG: YqgE/AlgH family protein [Candidatus Dormibacteraeota bacterium]|nr:YqgE/AlgH family protein [Candidatus Dormibacteraeota bacterium]